MPAINGKTLAQFAAISVILFGILTAMGSWTATNSLPNFFVDLLHWPVNGQESINTPSAQVIAAIGGGVMVGWGVNMLLITQRFFETDLKIWSLLTFPALTCWYVVDSTGSILAGAWLNAGLNLSFPLMFGLAYMRARSAKTEIQHA